MSIPWERYFGKHRSFRKETESLGLLFGRLPKFLQATKARERLWITRLSDWSGMVTMTMRRVKHGRVCVLSALFIQCPTISQYGGISRTRKWYPFSRGFMTIYENLSKHLCRSVQWPWCTHLHSCLQAGSNRKERSQGSGRCPWNRGWKWRQGHEWVCWLPGRDWREQCEDAVVWTSEEDKP